MALENKLQNEQKAQGSELEKKVVDAPQEKSTSLFSYLLHGTAAAASTVYSYAAVGINGPLTGVAFVVGRGILSLFKKTKTSLVNLMDEMTVGSLVGIVGSKLYEYYAKLIPNPTFATKALRGAAAVIIGNPIFVSVYLSTEYFVKHPFDLAGNFKHVKDNLWKMNKETIKYLGIPVAMTVNGYWGGYPGIVAADAGYRVVFGLKGKKEPNEEKKPAPNYQPTTPTPAYGGSR
ncbi:hypothetical protein HQ529_01655 [Candidatus Woesearchaeota archaeon]|nr:hypothetical protein [Candidatus Woesearchaeota archaeon]